MDKAEISPKQTFRMPVYSTLTNKEASISSLPVPFLPESKPVRPFLKDKGYFTGNLPGGSSITGV